MDTHAEWQDLPEANALADALEAPLWAWMAREEARPADPAVVGGLAEFVARTLVRTLQAVPAVERSCWMAAWLELLNQRLLADIDWGALGRSDAAE